MSAPARVRFACPSCATSLAAVEIGAATVVVRRTCRRCGERWQLVAAHIGTGTVGRLADGSPAPAEFHRATFTFLGRTGAAATAYGAEAGR